VAERAAACWRWLPERAAACWRRLAASRWLYCACAAAIAAGALLELLLVPGMSDDAIAPFVVLVLCAPVIAARRHPVAATIGEGLVLALTPAVNGEFPSLPLLALAAVTYGSGAYATLRAGALAVGALMALMLAGSAAAGVPAAIAALAPWWTGRQVRRRRTLVRELAERNRELEAEEDAVARLSVQRERARIARELHDIVAHHLAVIVVQAGAGRLGSPTQAERAAERFASIRQAGGHALAEMARLVDVLHADGDADRWRSLRLLLERAEAAGLELDVTAPPRDVTLAPELEEVAYRVVQEGLTNAIKHAPGSAVAVGLQVTGGALELEVRNGGDAAPSSLAGTGAGLGLRGMRERVEALGGKLDAGPDPSGGWRLRARLPVLTPAR
jgi:signal transduction histidine kinase